MDYDDSDAGKWKEYFKLDADLAERSPGQFERYISNIKETYEQKRGMVDREGDGWLDWKDINWEGKL